MPEANITKRALGASLKTLMQTTPFHKISVGDICENCGMHRKSFYYHFQDKYDLLNWLFYSEFMQLLDPEGQADTWEYMRRVCAYFAENRKFYLNAFAIEGQNAFADTFNETLEAILNAYLHQQIPDDEFRDFFCAFYSDAFRCAIVRWLREGVHTSVDEFVALCERTLDIGSLHPLSAHSLQE
jgi:probable dihydroxyacetone kinase regulator